MAKILDLSFNTSSDFSNCRYIGANGTFETGPELPNGIAGRISIDDGACRMHLKTTDANTADWKRTEIDFGEFPSAIGEIWSTFEFKYDWSFDNYVVIGSWSVMINDVAGQTYVPIGFRIRNKCLVIQAPANLGELGFNNQDLAVESIAPGVWHRVCVHADMQAAAGAGFREVFLNNKPIVRQVSLQTTYSTATAHYFKLGPYDGLHTAAFSEATMFIRNVTMWTGNDGYLSVLGGAPQAPTRLVTY